MDDFNSQRFSITEPEASEVERGDLSTDQLPSSVPSLGAAFEPHEFSLAMQHVPAGAGLGLNLSPSSESPVLGDQYQSQRLTFPPSLASSPPLEPSSAAASGQPPELGTQFDPYDFHLAISDLPSGAGLGLNLNPFPLKTEGFVEQPESLKSTTAPKTAEVGTPASSRSRSG